MIERTEEQREQTKIEFVNKRKAAMNVDSVMHEILSAKTLTSIHLQILACDFAENILNHYEDKHPKESLQRQAIETKRLWIERRATDHELSLARSLAYDDGVEKARKVFHATKTTPPYARVYRVVLNATWGGENQHKKNDQGYIHNYKLDAASWANRTASAARDCAWHDDEEPSSAVSYNLELQWQIHAITKAIAATQLQE